MISNIIPSLTLDCLTSLAGTQIGTHHMKILSELGVNEGQHNGLVQSLFRYVELSFTTGLGKYHSYLEQRSTLEEEKTSGHIESEPSNRLFTRVYQ